MSGEGKPDAMVEQARELAERLTEGVYDVPALETRAEFKEALQSALTTLLREKDEEIGRLTDGWFVDEGLTPDGGLRPFLSRTLARLQTAESQLSETRQERDAEVERARGYLLSLEAGERERAALREALEKLLPRYEHLCSVLVIRDSTWAIRELARAALSERASTGTKGETPRDETER